MASQHFGNVQYPGAGVARAPQAAFNVQHATQVSHDYRIGTAGMNMGAFIVSNGCRDVAEFHGKGAAKTAALLTLLKRHQLDTRLQRQQAAWLQLDAEFA